jgi:anti-anti-sigma factor
MNYQKTSEKDITVFTVKLKRATMSESNEFKTLLLEEVESGKKKIIVDMNECEFIDSTFLGVLVTSLKKFSGTEGEIVLVGFDSKAKSIIDITGTSKIFRIFPTVKQALSSLTNNEVVL